MSTSTSRNRLLSKIKDFWQKYEPKIILILGLILVSVISFQVGVLKGQKSQESPLILEKAPECNNAPESTQNSLKSQNLTSGTVSTKIGEETPQSCQFVASKTSNKYHKSTCTWVKKIKAENKICFSSEEEAQKNGKMRAGCCFK